MWICTQQFVGICFQFVSPKCPNDVYAGIQEVPVKFFIEKKKNKIGWRICCLGVITQFKCWEMKTTSCKRCDYALCTTSNTWLLVSFNGFVCMKSFNRFDCLDPCLQEHHFRFSFETKRFTTHPFYGYQLQNKNRFDDAHIQEDE